MPSRAIALLLAAFLALAPALAASGDEGLVVDAVLVMIVGPGEGAVGLDPDSLVNFTFVLPGTKRIFVRATLHDASGAGVNGRLVTGELRQPGEAPVRLVFSQSAVSGAYASQTIAYAGADVAFDVVFDVSPERVEKRYVPLPTQALLPPGTSAG